MNKCIIKKSNFTISLADVATVWKVSKNGVFPGPLFPVCGLSTGKYGPKITAYLNIP